MASFEERFEAVRERGRTLIGGAEATVHYDDPFLLAADARAGALDAAIRGVSTFAVVMAAIVTLLVVVGAAPKMVEIFATFWVIAAISGRIFARHRRSQLGRTLIDFDAGLVEHAPLSGGPRSFALDGLTLKVTRSADAEAPYWITLVAGGKQTRLARATEEQVDRALVIFRRYKVPVERIEEET